MQQATSIVTASADVRQAEPLICDPRYLFVSSCGQLRTTVTVLGVAALGPP